MLKFRNDQTVVLGLDKENLRRLKNGEPIKIPRSDLKLEVDIYIAYGEKVEDIQKEFGLPSIT